MEIIRHGKINDKTDQLYELTCECCGCEFRFLDSEIESREKRLDGNCTIRCPECYHRISFVRSNLPAEKFVDGKIISEFIDVYEDPLLKECTENWKKALSTATAEPITVDYVSDVKNCCTCTRAELACPCDDCADDFKFGVSCPDRQSDTCKRLKNWRKNKENGM